MSPTLPGICVIVAMLVIAVAFYSLPNPYKAYLRIIVGLALLAVLWFTVKFDGLIIKIIFTFSFVLASYSHLCICAVDVRTNTSRKKRFRVY